MSGAQRRGHDVTTRWCVRKREYARASWYAKACDVVCVGMWHVRTCWRMLRIEQNSSDFHCLCYIAYRKWHLQLSEHLPTL